MKLSAASFTCWTLLLAASMPVVADAATLKRGGGGGGGGGRGGVDGKTKGSSSLRNNDVDDSRRILKSKKGSSIDNYFQRVSYFPICKQIDNNCNTDIETNAESIVVSNDGMTVIYTNGYLDTVGFVDITDVTNPLGLGEIDLSQIGDGINQSNNNPYGLAVCGDYVIVAIDTTSGSSSTGRLTVFDIATQEQIRDIFLTGSGAPYGIDVNDSVTCTKVAITIRNTYGKGSVGILDVSDQTDPDTWTLNEIDLVGQLSNDIAWGNIDPEPKRVSLRNSDNLAVITMQLNNGLVILDTDTYSVTNSFSAGVVDLEYVDVTDNNVIDQTDTLKDVKREPDGVTWLGDDSNHFATADEGNEKLHGSRGFTIFKKNGRIMYTSGTTLEFEVASMGHSNEDIADSRGNEPEMVTYDEYDGDKLLFVVSEKGHVVFVFDVNDEENPELLQTLPSTSYPEGIYTIPDRDLFVVATDQDDRDSGHRSAINIYQRGYEKPSYPTLKSTVQRDDDGKSPIPFGALSALSASTCNNNRVTTAFKENDAYPDFWTTLDQQHCGDSYCPIHYNKYHMYTIEDNSYNEKRILTINTDTKGDADEYYAGEIIAENYITDDNGVYFAKLQEFGYDDYEIMEDFISFHDATKKHRVNKLDLEGLTIATNFVDGSSCGVTVGSSGGYWIVHETTDDLPYNLLIKVSESYVIESVLTLPDDYAEEYTSGGFGGVAESPNGQYLLIPIPKYDGVDTLIAIYDMLLGEWKYVRYTKDSYEGQYTDDSEVYLSDIAPVGYGFYLVLERDNRSGLDADVKRLYLIHITDDALSDIPAVKEFISTTYTISTDNDNKWLVKDLLEDLQTASNGPILETVDGVTVDEDGNVWLVTDNNYKGYGVEELQFLNLGVLTMEPKYVSDTVELIQVCLEDTDCIEIPLPTLDVE